MPASARADAETGTAPLLTIAARPLKGDGLIVVTNVAPRTAIETDRKRVRRCRSDRWRTTASPSNACSAMPGPAASTSEDTRLADPRKLGLLMSLVARAWAGRAAADLLGKHAPPRRIHGHYARSWFRTGFDHIRNRLRSDPCGAIASWHRITPKPAHPGGVV